MHGEQLVPDAAAPQQKQPEPNPEFYASLGERCFLVQLLAFAADPILKDQPVLQVPTGITDPSTGEMLLTAVTPAHALQGYGEDKVAKGLEDNTGRMTTLSKVADSGIVLPPGVVI